MAEGMSAWVNNMDGLASVNVFISLEDGKFCWAYGYGEEIDTLADSGCCSSLPEAFEEIAQSLCEIGFDTTTDLVEEAFNGAERMQD